MSHKDNSPFVHPYIFYIISFGMEYPISCLRNNEVGPFARGLHSFCLTLDPDLKKTLKSEMKYLQQIRTNEIGEPPIDELIETTDKIFTAIHEAGYFLSAKMTPPTRKGGLGMLEERLNKKEPKKRSAKS